MRSILPQRSARQQHFHATRIVPCAPMRHHGKPITSACSCSWVIASRTSESGRPDEAALMQPARAQPDADAIVHQQLEPSRTSIGEEVGVMSTRFAEYANHARERRFRSGAHVDRLDCQPHRVDANHRSNSRNQAEHSGAAANGQSTFATIAPRRSSIVIDRGVAAGEESSAIGMKLLLCSTVAAADTLAASIDVPGCARSSVTTHRRTRFAFRPFASATAAIDTPGLRHAVTTFALNSALCVRRRRRTMLPSSAVSMCPPRN